MKAINPATEQLVHEFPDHTPTDVERLLVQAGNAFSRWRGKPIEKRAALLRAAAAVLRRRKEEFALLMTREMGKPITGAEAEIEKCAACCEHFAEHAARYLAREQIESDAASSYVRYDPIGAVFAIMPWNFPFWQVFRFAAPTLMAGNVAVLKHAENVPGCARAIEEVFRAADFPVGAFTTLLIDRSGAEAVIRNPVIRAVTLTGSDRAGMAVASQAGSVLKKTVLELGGSDPFIVLRDADVEAVAKKAAEARCINSGQSCIAAKRFIVEGAIADRFEQAMAAALAAMRVGDPEDRATQIGPLARKDLLDNLADQVERSVHAGARLVTGGRRIDRKGFFYEPTLLAKAGPRMPAFDEETFGPVAVLTPFSDIDQAIDLANQSRYGLGASIWTAETARAERIAAEIDAGCVFINGIVKSDPRLPFGGVKNSGYGRELSAHGIHEFTNIKTVWVGRP